MSSLPRKRPFLLLVTSAGFFCAAALLSNTFFPDLGPSAERLTAEDPLVRRVAQVTVLEILLVRSILVVSGAIAFLIWAAWIRFRESGFVRALFAHEPTAPSSTKFLNPSLFLMLALTASIIIWLTAVSSGILPMWRVVIMEDGVVELSTTIAFLLCSALAAFIAIRIPEARRRWVHGFLAIGFLACAGEEVSWGQRFFQYGTPEFLLEINNQGEANLHNSFGYAADHIFIFGVVLYGIAFPFFSLLNEFFRKLFDYLGLPIASPGLALGFLLASLMNESVIYSFIEPTEFRLSEARELISSVGFLLLMLETIVLSHLAAPRTLAKSRNDDLGTGASLSGSIQENTFESRIPERTGTSQLPPDYPGRR